MSSIPRSAHIDTAQNPRRLSWSAGKPPGLVTSDCSTPLTGGAIDNGSPTMGISIYGCQRQRNGHPPPLHSEDDLALRHPRQPATYLAPRSETYEASLAVRIN